MGIFAQLNRLGILSVGRRPEWREQADTTGAPASPGDGVALGGAVKTLVHVALREEAHRRISRAGITYDSDTTYIITIDGTQVETVADADEATTLAAMADDINADGAAGAVVSASVVEGQLVLLGLGEADYTVVVDTDGGTGTIDLTADATTTSTRIWLLPGGTGDAPVAWAAANNGDLGADYRGITERLSTAGFDRLYVEVYDADGEVSVVVGPGVME